LFSTIFDENANGYEGDGHSEEKRNGGVELQQMQSGHQKHKDIITSTSYGNPYRQPNVGQSLL
jgi:hypothetical protein